jgi:hypothetical protein
MNPCRFDGRRVGDSEPTMRAVVLKEFSGPENLTLDDFPIPRVGPDQFCFVPLPPRPIRSMSVSPREPHSAHLSQPRSDATSLESWR